MPKKKNQESQEDQSERFNKAVADLVAAGELNLTEADEKLERLTKVTVSGAVDPSPTSL